MQIATAAAVAWRSGLIQVQRPRQNHSQLCKTDAALYELDQAKISLLLRRVGMPLGEQHQFRVWLNFCCEFFASSKIMHFYNLYFGISS